MPEPKTIPRWKIGLWIVMAALLLAWIGDSLIEGEVVMGKSHTHYLRRENPGGYWFGIAFYSVILGILIHALLTSKPHPKKPPQPLDLTPRDWMGNPLDRK